MEVLVTGIVELATAVSGDLAKQAIDETLRRILTRRFRDAQEILLENETLALRTQPTKNPHTARCADDTEKKRGRGYDRAEPIRRSEALCFVELPPWPGVCTRRKIHPDCKNDENERDRDARCCNNGRRSPSRTKPYEQYRQQCRDDRI